MILNFLTALFAFVSGLYINVIWQVLDSIVSWVNGAESDTDKYEIKIEDYYDGLTQSGSPQHYVLPTDLKQSEHPFGYTEGSNTLKRLDSDQGLQ